MSDVPDATLRPRRFSWVWLIPVASVLIGAWLLYSSLSRRGPLVSITFDSAEGLQAGQSQVRYKDIQMGTIETFDLTPDRKRVVMRVRMTSKADPLLTEGAQFWVVKPRLFAGDLTGLSTVLSGPYMEMLPGDPDRPERTEYTGLENPPTLDPDNPGRQFKLTENRIGSISVGSPLFFHDLEVGKVLGYDVNGMADSVTLSVFVRKPYDQWVHDDSRFWNTSGFTLSLGGNGVQLQVDSLKAAFLGGITFDTPSSTGHDRAAAEGSSFPLYPSQQQAEIATGPRRAVFASYVAGSVGSLTIGARVTLQGFEIGYVTAVDLQYDIDVDRTRVRVEYTVQIGQVTVVGSKPEPPYPENVALFVRDGLRAHVRGSNLLTGQKEVALELDTDPAPAEMGREGDMLIIPAGSDGAGGVDSLTATASQLLTKLERVPFAQIGQSLSATLAGVSAIANGPQLKQAIARLNDTLAATDNAVRHLDQSASPAIKRLPAIASDLQATLAEIRRLTGSLADGTGSDSKLARDLDRVLEQVTQTARSVRMVADLLSRHPEALIRGRATRGVE